VIHITTAIPADVAALAALSIQCFYETYAAFNTEANMQQYVDEHFSTQRLLIEMDTPASIFFLAYNDDVLVGYVRLRENDEPTALKDIKHIELERIYVLKEYHHLKIGKQLLHACIEHAGNNNYAVIWLGVWEHNAKAMGFYERMGFEKFGEHIFMLGDDAQKDWLMKKQIV
jgi:ribosomal protein S18 acetylase RimI-like enzyme